MLNNVNQQAVFQCTSGINWRYTRKDFVGYKNAAPRRSQSQKLKFGQTWSLSKTLLWVRSIRYYIWWESIISIFFFFLVRRSRLLAILHRDTLLLDRQPIQAGFESPPSAVVAPGQRVLDPTRFVQETEPVAMCLFLEGVISLIWSFLSSSFFCVSALPFRNVWDQHCLVCLKGLGKLMLSLSVRRV